MNYLITKYDLDAARFRCENIKKWLRETKSENEKVKEAILNLMSAQEEIIKAMLFMSKEQTKIEMLGGDLSRSNIVNLKLSAENEELKKKIENLKEGL